MKLPSLHHCQGKVRSCRAGARWPGRASPGVAGPKPPGLLLGLAGWGCDALTLQSPGHQGTGCPASRHTDMAREGRGCSLQLPLASRPMEEPGKESPAELGKGDGHPAAWGEEGRQDSPGAGAGGQARAGAAEKESSQAPAAQGGPVSHQTGQGPLLGRLREQTPAWRPLQSRWLCSREGAAGEGPGRRPGTG